MKGCAIIFLLLVLPAIQSSVTPPSTPGDGTNAGAPVNPSDLLKELSGDLTGPNGILKGLGLDATANNLLNGLIGPNGNLTSLFPGKFGNLIAEVLRFFLAPNGFVSAFVGPKGLFAGNSQMVKELLNSILGLPNGIVQSLFGDHNIQGRGGGGLLNIVLELVEALLNSLGLGGILGGGGSSGPLGGLSSIVNLILQLLGLGGGGNGNVAALLQALIKAKSGGMMPNQGGNGGGPTTGGDELDSALCQLQMTSGTTLVNATQSCVMAVTSLTLSKLLMTEINGLTCNSDGTVMSGAMSQSWVPSLSDSDAIQLISFLACIVMPS